MTPSVGPEADRELTDSALYYTREGNAKLGLAFIATFERALELLCSNPQLGATWRNERFSQFARLYRGGVYSPSKLNPLWAVHSRHD